MAAIQRRQINFYVNNQLQHTRLGSINEVTKIVSSWIKLYPKNKYLIYYDILIF